MFLFTRFARKALGRCYRHPVSSVARLLSQQNTSSFHQINLNSDESQHLRQQLMNKLKLSFEEANLALLKWIISSDGALNHEESNKVINLLQAHFDLDDIKHNPTILNAPISELQNKINILNELGFRKLELNLVQALPALLTQTVSEIKSNGIYPDTRNPLECLVEYFQAQHLFPENCDGTTLFSSSDIAQADTLTLSEIRKRFLYVLVRHYLDCSDQVATHSVDNLNSEKNLDYFSLTRIVTNLQIYSTVISLPINQLIKHFNFVATCDTENLVKLSQIGQLKELPALCRTFFTRQRLCQMEASQIQERIDLLLGKYRCRLDQLAQCIFIFDLTPREIEQHFDKYQRYDELKIYAGHQDFLRLIVNIDQAVSNLSSLTEHDISSKYITLHNLLKSNSKFMNMVNNSNFKLTLSAFIQLHFGITLKEIKNKVGTLKMASRALNSLNAESIVSYFREQGLSNEQIINGIYLIYYDPNEVRSMWQRLFYLPEVQQSDVDWRSHPNVLQLLFYFVEKVHKL